MDLAVVMVVATSLARRLVNTPQQPHSVALTELHTHSYCIIIAIVIIIVFIPPLKSRPSGQDRNVIVIIHLATSLSV